MLSVKYILFLLHLSPSLLNARSLRDVDFKYDNCIKLLDTYISLILKDYPGIKLPIITYKELFKIAQYEFPPGSIICGPNSPYGQECGMPVGGSGKLKDSEKTAGLIEELRHFLAATNYLIEALQSNQPKNNLKEIKEVGVRFPIGGRMYEEQRNPNTKFFNSSYLLGNMGYESERAPQPGYAKRYGPNNGYYEGEKNGFSEGIDNWYLLPKSPVINEVDQPAPSMGDKSYQPGDSQNGGAIFNPPGAGMRPIRTNGNSKREIYIPEPLRPKLLETYPLGGAAQNGMYNPPVSPVNGYGTYRPSGSQHHGVGFAPPSAGMIPMNPDMNREGLVKDGSVSKPLHIENYPQGTGSGSFRKYENEKTTFEHNVFGGQGNHNGMFEVPASPVNGYGSYHPGGNQINGISSAAPGAGMRPMQTNWNQGGFSFTNENATPKQPMHIDKYPQKTGSSVSKRYENEKTNIEHKTFEGMGHQKEIYEVPASRVNGHITYQPDVIKNNGVSLAPPSASMRQMHPNVNQGGLMYAKEDFTPIPSTQIEEYPPGTGSGIYKKYENLKTKFEHNSIGGSGNQEGMNKVPSSSANGYATNGMQNNGINIASPGAGMKPSKGEFAHYKQPGVTSVVKTTEKYKEETKHHELGDKTQRFRGADSSQEDTLGFYLAGGEVKGQANQQQGESMLKKTRSPKVDQLEVIEPGGVREVVKGGQKIRISNTNCPDNSELCIKIDS